MSTIEWTIENISHWNKAKHGRAISSPITEGMTMYFYPHGAFGDQENLELHLNNFRSGASKSKASGSEDGKRPVRMYTYLKAKSVEMVYESSSGSTVTVKLTPCGVSSFKGPKFDALVADLKKDNPDKITMKCLMDKPYSNKYVTRI